MKKYIVCFTIEDSTRGSWFDTLNTAMVTAEDPFQACLLAVQETHNSGFGEDCREGHHPDFWSLQRTYLELLDDEEVYWSFAVIDLEWNCLVDVSWPSGDIQRARVHQQNCEAALKVCQTMLLPFDSQTSPALPWCPSELRDSLTHVQLLAKRYDDEVQKAKAVFETCKQQHDSMLTLGKLQREAVRGRESARWASPKQPAPKKKATPKPGKYQDF